jgi:hypothetical protein
MVKYKFIEKANSYNVIVVEAEDEAQAVYVLRKLLLSITGQNIYDKFKIEKG